jgi:signal transduction histidine kinase
MLKNAGYECLAAGNGLDALEFLKTNAVDLIITDIIMPDMDGMELLEEIKRKYDTHVIIITAYAKEYPTHEIIEKGADDFIQKPIAGSELVLRVKRVLKTRQLIADSKRTEKKLRSAQERFRAVVAKSGEMEEDLRKTLAMELHDRIGQNLTALNININVLKNTLSAQSLEKSTKIFDDTLDLIRETAEHARDIMARLRPVGLDDYGLEGAIHAYVKRFADRTGIRVQVHVDGYAERLPINVEMLLFRIVQETFTNIAKHSHATKVNLWVEESQGRVVIRIADNGRGFDLNTIHIPKDYGGWGLITMRERMRLHNGKFKIESKPGQGTTVSVSISRAANVSEEKEFSKWTEYLQKFYK